jgi:hypothetical protein
VDKTIVTAFTIIASIACVLVLFQAVYPMVSQGSAAMVSMESRMADRLRSDVGLVHTSGELDADQLWQDTNSNGLFDVFVWAKNLGSLRLEPLESCDVFFGPEGNFSRIPHQSLAGGTYPYWTATLENGATWDPTCTLRITVHFSSVLASDRYYVKVVAPTGVSDDLSFGL